MYLFSQKIIPRSIKNYFTAVKNCSIKAYNIILFRILIYIISGYIILSVLSAFLLPSPLFDTTYSKVIYSKDEYLLGAKIAEDYQWRFPISHAVPEKYETALLLFEDKRFYYHPGIDPVAVVRAVIENIRHKKIVSGASTLSMQVIRLSRNNPKRTWAHKLYETFLTIGIEFRYSKKEILELYAAHAPYGGNVVGFTAASWRYFGRAPENLTWAESALLAVLPNSPALIHPGRNKLQLKAKRDALLLQLFESGRISEMDYSLALSERLPAKPLPLPRYSPHLLETLALKHKTMNEFHTTINYDIQINSNAVLSKHHKRLTSRGVYNICTLIIDNQDGEVVCYIGNSPDPEKNEKTLFSDKGYSVDIIQRPRSTGSILKPLLYAAMLHDGEITPESLIRDVPMHFGGYSPKNFSRNYAGVIPARTALAQSLNVPAVAMLQQYGYQRFYKLLKDAGMSTLFRSADEYGLTLILGGAEGTLWDITKMYSALSQKVTHKSLPELQIINNNKSKIDLQSISPGAAYLTLEAMLDVERPGIDSYWKSFAYSQKIAWKTGTSLGHRDAWAVGVTKKYTVGVWCGNSDGEGKPGMTGLAVAAPVLFEIFSSLEKSDWFTAPYNDLKTIEICSRSGYLPTEHCNTVSILVPKSAGMNKLCPYHRVIHIDPETRLRVTGDCFSISRMEHIVWFTLPPVEEYYYKKNHPEYKKLPDYKSGCNKNISYNNHARMRLIYPSSNTSAYIPVDISGNKSEIIFKAAHINEDSTIFWHIDNKFITKTRTFHEISIQPGEGNHVLTLIDETGYTIEQKFNIIGSDN